MASFIFCCLILTLFSHIGSSSTELSSSLDLVPGKTSWTNNDHWFTPTTNFSDGSIARFMLLKQNKLDKDSGFGYGFCFYCTSSISDTCFVSILFVEMSNDTIRQGNHVIVWSANRDRPVGRNAVLELDASGNLVLYDGDSGSFVWSSDTTGCSVSKMTMIHNGNLVLVNSTGGRVWQSFQYITDTLLDGQVLSKWQRLTLRVEAKNLTSGLFYLIINGTSLCAYAKGNNKPTKYLFVQANDVDLHGQDLEYVEFRKVNLSFYYYGARGSPVNIANSTAVQFMKLDSDGGLRVHGWNFGEGWKGVHVFLLQGKNECQIPLRCGTYGVCSAGNECSCPVSFDRNHYFKPKDKVFPNYGCVDTLGQLPGGMSDQFRMVNFGHLSYFSYSDETQAVPGLEDEDSCVDACERDSSCMAAFYAFNMSLSKGYCFLIEEVLSVMASPISNQYYSSSHLKVRIQPQAETPSPSTLQSSKIHRSKSNLGLIPVAGFICLFISLILMIASLVVWKKKRLIDWYKQGFFDQMISSEIHIKRFSFKELCTATSKFSEKLGRGGFGSVFKGVLKDGTVIAVKQLETKRGTKEFLAEMETLGNIHHVNLVRLIGYCVNTKNRMLVYEYMSRGSLDKWIFSKNKNTMISWNARKKIVLGIAKGLMYLHEECRHKIAHLDVKPHNILLDDDFNVKISDFGLSKLISRDESQVVTEARGTLGYLAPEWEHSRITVKADVYSFGIVLLEIVCGRSILDYTQPQSDVHLLTLLGKKASENKLKDMVDGQDEDTRNNSKEAVEMMKMGMWCSEIDHSKRPSMSLVVKILEGENKTVKP